MLEEYEEHQLSISAADHSIHVKTSQPITYSNYSSIPHDLAILCGRLIELLLCSFQALEQPPGPQGDAMDTTDARVTYITFVEDVNLMSCSFSWPLLEIDGEDGMPHVTTGLEANAT